MKHFTKAMFGILLSTAISSPAFAATADGDVGATSTGTADISVTIPQLVKITDIDTLTLGSYDGAGNESLDDAVCIYSNTTAGTYTVNITGAASPAAGAVAGFFIGNGTTDDEIPFTMTWNDEISAGGTAITHNSTLAAQSGVSDDPACDGLNNANFQVTFTEANLLDVQPGAYTNTITIVITPE